MNYHLNVTQEDMRLHQYYGKIRLKIGQNEGSWVESLVNGTMPNWHLFGHYGSDNIVFKLIQSLHMWTCDQEYCIYIGDGLED